MVALKKLLHPLEKERMAALTTLKILDTPSEERFDRITRLAVDIFNVPFAYISLIDENRQWIKSCQGSMALEVPRETSFCAHTILRNEPLIIADTYEDPAFKSHPFVTNDPHIRFYAGHPLLANGKHPIGSFCLSDKKPRLLEAREQALFQQLARLVEYELHLVDKINAQKHLLQMQEDLLASQKSLARELAEGARYVRSLLPPPIKHGPVEVNWFFMPSVQLGGDAFYYHWLDPDRFAFALLDAAGHGLSAAFLSVSILDTLRAGREADQGYDLSQPAQVLSYLNRRFAMGEHANMFFTIWYGVYQPSTRKLTYACGGNPQVVHRSAKNTPKLLGNSSFLLGAFPQATFENQTCELALGDQLYLFSDGLYEARSKTGTRSSVQELSLQLQAMPREISAEETVHRIRKMREIQFFDDDVSLLILRFP